MGAGELVAIDLDRRDRVVEAIERSSLEALACFTPTNVLLLTGYWPVMGTSLAVATREGHVVCVVPEDELELANATSNADFISYKPHTLDSLSRASQSLELPVKELASRLHFVAGEIGTDTRMGMQPASYQSTNYFRESIVPLLQKAFPGASVVPADCILSQLKSIKTCIELDQLRRACRLAAVAFGETRRAIAPGRREDEIAAELEAAFAKVAIDGFERGRGYLFCMSGANSAKASGAYARTRRRKLQDGDLVMIHANTTGDGIWTDITRTYVVGNPASKQTRMRDAIMEARAAALVAIRPGVTAGEVDKPAREVLKRHGFGDEFKHATGHGVGFAAADPHALPRIHPLSPDILEAGMTFNIEPAIYFDGYGGMRHCDVVACTDSGVEVLTDF